MHLKNLSHIATMQKDHQEWKPKITNETFFDKIRLARLNTIKGQLQETGIVKYYKRKIKKTQVLKSCE